MSFLEIRLPFEMHMLVISSPQGGTLLSLPGKNGRVAKQLCFSKVAQMYSFEKLSGYQYVEDLPQDDYTLSRE